MHKKTLGNYYIYYFLPLLDYSNYKTITSHGWEHFRLKKPQTSTDFREAENTQGLNMGNVFPPGRWESYKETSMIWVQYTNHKHFCL